MKQAYLQNLGMIVTEKCNLNCAHCMRGKKTCKNMHDDVIKATLDNVYGMGNLAICGGEPTMACDINVTLMVSFDDYRHNEIIKLNMTNLYLENLKRYKKSEFFRGLKNINGKLFNEGEAKKLSNNITEPLKPMPIYYTYTNKKNNFKNDKENGSLGIGPLITVNPEGIITETNASIENQHTIYNYGNILTESLEEIVERQGIITNPINWYSDCSKAIKESKRYRKY